MRSESSFDRVLMLSPVPIAGGQPSKGSLLFGARHAPRGGEVARPVMVVEVRDGAVDLAREVLALRLLGKASEVGGEHLAPVEAHLPRAGFVGEEDDAVGILVDPSQKEEKQLERLANGSMWPLLSRADAFPGEPVELGGMGQHVYFIV